MGITNSNKVINMERIDCDGSLKVTLALTAAPDIVTNPTDIALVLDRSGSMTGEPLASMKTGAKTFIDIISESTGGQASGEIGSGSRIGIVGFSSTAVQDTQLITGVTVVRKAYAEEHPDVVAAFLADYAQSVNAANTDLDGTAALCEEQGVVAKAAIAKKALPNCNIVCLTGEELKADVSGYLQVLYDADPAAVGGTLPGEDFYWTAQ